jgi:pimeloyl-ACP methyl ester carboxylesterase
VSPDGQGRLLANYSWGSSGQITDLARMPEIVRRTLPWLHIAPHRVYGFGGSMGGQEILLLVARYPHLLAGAAAFDPVVDFALQYRDFPRLACSSRCRKTWNGPIGRSLQKLAREELGGSPARARYAYELRSPLTYARAIAFAHVPLQLWWSPRDRIVVQQRRQSARFFKTVTAQRRRTSSATPAAGTTRPRSGQDALRSRSPPSGCCRPNGRRAASRPAPAALVTSVLRPVGSVRRRRRAGRRHVRLSRARTPRPARRDREPADKQITEPVALSSTASADRSLWASRPSASNLQGDIDLLALRAR